MNTEDNEWVMRRKSLVDGLVREGHLSKQRVIDAMLKVPRHMFVPSNIRDHSYDDRPLSIGQGQTISAPHMVAMMSECLDVKPEHKILEIGSGSGYQAAILAELASNGKVFTLERVPELAKMAEENIRKCGYKNVYVILREGTIGYEDESPYDRIIVTAGAPKIPEKLLDQLKDNGKLLMPIGSRTYQTLKLIEKRDGRVGIKNICGCIFVPLIGKDGWRY